MSCKSVLYTALPATTAVNAGDVMPLGNVVRRFGSAIRLDGNTIVLTEPGYYAVSVTSTVQPTGTTAFNVQIEENGTLIPGAITTVAPTAAGNSTPMMIPRAICRVYCNGIKSLALRITAAGNVTHLAVAVEKV